MIAEPHQVGRPLVAVDPPPAPGDLVKAPFVFRAADEHGDVVQRVEYMWVLLDEVRPDGAWSGTLGNHPFVPGPIDAGSRVWLGPAQVLAVNRRSAGPGGAPPGTLEARPSALRRVWRRLRGR